MLAAKMSAGVTPEVNLRNQLQHRKQSIEVRNESRYHKKFKTGESVIPQKDFCPLNCFLKKILCSYFNTLQIQTTIFFLSTPKSI